MAAGQVTTALAECSSQCAGIVSGFGTCSSVQCLCPTVSVDGGGCSACLDPINTADAGFVGSLMSECGVTGTAASITTSTGLNSAAASSSVTTASHSGGQGGMMGVIYGTSFMGIFIYLTVLAGLAGCFI